MRGIKGFVCSKWLCPALPSSPSPSSSFTKVARSLLAAHLISVAFASQAWAQAEGFEKQALSAINKQRTAAGLAPWMWDEALARLAREQSESMRSSRSLSHDGFEDRFAKSGSRGCVENVAMGYEHAGSLVEGWVASPSHRKNMEDKMATKVGVAMVGEYATMFACR